MVFDSIAKDSERYKKAVSSRGNTAINGRLLGFVPKSQSKQRPVGPPRFGGNWTSDDMLCKTPGQKIRSEGRGRGLARGRGIGPVGTPIYSKDWDYEDMLSVSPGGRGRGLGRGRGRGPIGRPYTVRGI